MIPKIDLGFLSYQIDSIEEFERKWLNAKNAFFDCFAFSKRDEFLKKEFEKFDEGKRVKFKVVKAQCAVCGKYHKTGILVIFGHIFSKWAYFGKIPIPWKQKFADYWECPECYYKKQRNR